MLGDLLLAFYHFFTKKKPLFLVFFLSLVSVLALGIVQLKVTESIFSTLPKGESFNYFNKLIENKKITNQIVFSLDVDPDSDIEDVRELTETFRDTIKAVSQGAVTDIITERSTVQQDLYDYSYQHFPELIDSSYYRAIDDRISADSISSAIANSYKALLGPGGAFVKQFILNDPIYITTPYFKELNAANNSSGVVIEDGLVFTKDKKQVLITAVTNFDSGNSKQNTALYTALESFKQDWIKTYPKNQFSYFGTFAIAAQNAIQIKHDSSLTMVISVVLILIVLLVYYRKLLIPVYIILPAAFGALFSLGLIGYFKQEISGISLATGSVLFGIILDYSIHFFTHLRHTKSIEATIKDISAPLLTGSLTTIMAFTSLLFANSIVLQDFGLFAALSLSGAAFFTVLLLPIILNLLSFDYEKIPGELRLIRIPSLPQKYHIPALLIIVAITGVLFVSSGKIEFDSNLENLSVHNNDLKQKEQELTGMDPKTEKKIYVFAIDSSKAIAEENNYRVYQKLRQLKSEDQISSFVSTGSFLIPEQLKKERQDLWRTYWDSTNRKEKAFTLIDQSALQLGFNASAFTDFKDWISGISIPDQSGDSLLNTMGVASLVENDSSKTTIISTVVIKQENLDKVKAELRAIDGIELFDRSEVAGALLKLVKEDFNYILLVSASIVFITLLLIYGRIELTLLSFLPMAISWIWILGIAALLGIQFNFVNVVIATFIFGLGDDFSIFMTDGLLEKYKYNKDSLDSYKSAISLSAITTLIGTGVLFFAAHPAIHSISLISVLGISCIVVISFLFQPIFFSLFVQSRVDEKKAPLTLFHFLLTCLSGLFYITGYIFIYIILLLIIVYPISKKNKRLIINKIMATYGRLVIYSGPHVRKRITGLENLDINKPAIFICNHSSSLDNLMTIMIHPKLLLLVKSWVYNSPLFGLLIRHAGYIHSEEDNEKNLEEIQELINQGFSLLIFPEGTRSLDGKLKRFHKGAFFWAQELGLDIQPMILHGPADVFPKNDYFIKPGFLNIHVLPRIANSDSSWGTEFRERAKSISSYYKEEFRRFKSKKEDTAYLKNKLFQNYVYKGPILEWYFKVKWRMEEANYRYYDELIGDRKRILDIGCGYGFLSFYLHYRDENRIITGIDYDEEKASLAQNSFGKNENLNFISANIIDVAIEKQDVIFLNDILHYLSMENQLLVLNRCADALTPGGMMLIRDGITDLKERHLATQKTEKWSTRLLGFNKKDEELHFFSSDFVREFAQAHDLIYSMQEQSTKTSNVLFILKKNDSPNH